MAVIRDLKPVKLTGRERLLIIRPDRIGDLVLTLPVARCLRNRFSGLQIEFLVSDYNAPVLKYVNYIDGYIKIAHSESQPTSLISLLNKGRYDIAIFAKPGWLTAFAAFIADIPVRIGTARRAYSLLFNKMLNFSRKHSYYHELELNLLLLRALGISPGPEVYYPELQAVSSGRFALPGVTENEEYIVVHPGSRGSAPNWPIVSYVKLMEKLGRQIKVVATGKGGLLSDLPDGTVNMIDRTDFDGLVSIIAGAKLFVSGSTGPLHIAAALSVPVIGLFPDHPVLGPQRWGPRGKRAAYLTPSKQSIDEIRKNNNVKCVDLSSISVETVYRNALEMLGSRTMQI